MPSSPSPSEDPGSAMKPPTPNYGFDLLFLRRFFRLHGVLFPGFRSMNTVLFTLLLIVAAVEQYLAYNVGLIPGAFYKSLGSTTRDLTAFKWLTLRSVGIILSMTVTKSIRVFATRTLTIGWRKSLTVAMHRLYFQGIRFYQLNVLGATTGPDNPDQRLTSDVSLLTSTYGRILPDLILAPFTISYYSYDAYHRAGWIGPTAMLGFFLVSTVINKLLMSPIVRLTVEQERREGDFRFKHASLRANSEPLAFHGSVGVEESKTDERLFSLCDVQQRVTNRQLWLDLATNSFDYLGSIASYLVIAVPIFSGFYDGVESGELARIISENAFVCMYLVYQFSKLVDMSTTVAGLAGVTHRIAELAEVLAKMPKEGGLFSGSSSSSRSSSMCDPDNSLDTVAIVPNSSSSQCSPLIPRKPADSNVIFSLKSVTLTAPGSNTTLISGLTLDLRVGQHTLIMGKSSAGKSSLFRVLRGLWPLRDGRITCDDAKKIFFIPQKPFFTNGSLREQVVYPLQVAKELLRPEEDVWLNDMLEQLDLADLPRRAGGSLDSNPEWSSWSDVLSPGEMQRLAFIRLFYHRPEAAFLDEATAALSTDVEKLLYEKCLELGMTLVSVGHRDNLKTFHKRLLTVGLEDGGWEVNEL